MGRIAWDTQEPGHCEVDLVHHAGASSAGEYAYTLHVVDVATGWSERVALLSRGQAAMGQAIQTAFACLPFSVVELQDQADGLTADRQVLRRTEIITEQLRHTRPAALQS